MDMLSAAQQRYPVLLFDPPWSYRVDERDHGARGTARMHYGTMSLDEMRALPVADIAAETAALFMWATAPCMHEALALMSAWGFRYTTIAFTWVKLNRDGTPFVGLGHSTRGNAEFVLLGKRGRKSLPRLARDVSSVILAPRRQHSRKPIEVYERIERLYEGPYFEGFARTTRRGWATWGNEVGKYDGAQNDTREIATGTDGVRVRVRGARVVRLSVATTSSLWS